MDATWPPPASDCPVCRRLPASPSSRHPLELVAPTTVEEHEARDRVLGTLLGGAIGDGLGRLRERGRGLASERLSPGSLETGGATQLALFTAEGLLRMLVRYDFKGIGPAWRIMRHAYEDWLFTQGRGQGSVGAPGQPASAAGVSGRLARDHELHARRGGFEGTISALGSIEDMELVDMELRPRVNRSEGAGAVVRAAPIGLLVTAGVAFEVGVRNAALTHGGATAYLAAGAIAVLVARLLARQPLPEAVDDVMTELRRWPHHARLIEALESTLPADRPPSPSTPAATALSEGIRSCLGGGTIIDVLEQAIDRGGTAAAVVAGSAWGAAHGAGAMPGRIRVSADLAGAIEEMADAVAIGHRGWVLGHPVGPTPEPILDGSATAHLLSRWFTGG